MPLNMPKGLSETAELFAINLSKNYRYTCMTPPASNNYDLHSSTVKAVIFDLDGLLLDTEKLYTDCFEEFFARYGKTFDLQFKTKLMGRSSRETAQLCIEEGKLPISVDEFMREIKKLQEKAFVDCKMMPGAFDLVQRIVNEERLLTAIATSSASSTFAIKTKNHQELLSLMNAIVKGDDSEIKRAKPAPDIFLLAAKRLEVKPCECIVFEDSPNGVRAGLAAGIKVFWIPDKTLKFENECRDIYANPNVTILSSLEDFTPKESAVPN